MGLMIFIKLKIEMGDIDELFVGTSTLPKRHGKYCGITAFMGTPERKNFVPFRS